MHHRYPWQRLTMTLLIGLTLASGAHLLATPAIAQAEIDKERARQIATARLEKEPMGIDGRILSRVTYELTPFNWLLPESHKDAYAQEFRKRVQGKHYWILYWQPAKPVATGGDIAIFVDAADGSILFVYRGK